MRGAGRIPRDPGHRSLSRAKMPAGEGPVAGFVPQPRNKSILIVGVCVLLAAAAIAHAQAPAEAAPVTESAEGTIEEVLTRGLQRMTQEALLWAFGVRAGDPYDEAELRRKFRDLWERRLFRDITLEVEDGRRGGKVIVLRVVERPSLASVTYDDHPDVNKTAIEDRLEEKDAELRVGAPIDAGQIRLAESTIEDMFAERGYLDADVRAERSEVTTTSYSIHFSIRAGSKTRIRRIDFRGNELFRDKKLKKALELTEERRWYWPWSQKNLYHPAKWDQDVVGVRRLYTDRGYLDVVIGAPSVEVRSTPKTQAKEERSAARRAEKEARRARAEAAGKKRKKKKKERAPKRWVYLTVPVREGSQYRLGDVTIEGATVFPEDRLRAQIPMREGDVFNNSALEAGVRRISRGYEDQGHLYSNVVDDVDRRDGEQIADVTIRIDEDEPYTIGRIEFSGNSATRDYVLRRELALLEGQTFSRTLLDVSVRKINQLGYWQSSGEPILEPTPSEQTVDVTIEGIEQGRNEIQVGGGYSGLDGAFFNGVYSTRNLLGRGQVLSTAIQVGGRTNRYQLSFQEPHFLGRPYLLGVNLFRRDQDFGQSLQSTSRGWGLVLGKRLRRFSQISLSYNYEEVASRSFARSITGELIPFETDNTISSLTPVFSYSTINNPYRPTRGRNLSLSLQFAGGPLGGDTSYVKPLLNFVGYSPGFGRFHFAYHAQFGYVRAFGNDDRLNSSNIEGVPRYQRYWLGGDTLGPRIFETRTITPRRYVVLDDDNNIIDVLGDPRFLSPGDLLNSGGLPAIIEVGGDRLYLLQGELVLPMNEQAEIALFYDAGDTLFEDSGLNFDTLRMSAGVELRFHLPIFPVPLRLIYGWPVRKLDGDRTSGFTFSIGRAF